MEVLRIFCNFNCIIIFLLNVGKIYFKTKRPCYSVLVSLIYSRTLDLSLLNTVYTYSCFVTDRGIREPRSLFDVHKHTHVFSTDMYFTQWGSKISFPYSRGTFIISVHWCNLFCLYGPLPSYIQCKISFSYSCWE